MKLKNYLFLLVSVAAFGQGTNPYYAGTEGLTGYALKTKLSEILSRKTISWNYGDLPDFYKLTDVDRYYENNGSLLDIYSEVPDGPDAYEYRYELNQLISGASEEGMGWNREHIFSQSFFGGNYPMYSDLHFIVPTDARLNQRRSNWPFARVKNPTMVGSNGMKFGPSATPGRTTTAAEPIDEFKGDVARMLLYMATRYEGKLSRFNPDNERNPLSGEEEKAWEDWYIALLLDWHNLDPVSQREIDRNNYVYQIQGNRNPFVDHPEWATGIWNSNQSAEPAATPSPPQITKAGARFAVVEWQIPLYAEALGFRVYLNGELVGTTKERKFNLSHLSPSTTYTVEVSGYNSLYQESPRSVAGTFTTEAADNFSTDLLVTKFIEGTGNNKAIEIYNNTGYDVDLRDYSLTMQLRNNQTGSYYQGNGFEMEGTLPNGSVMVLMNPKSELSCMNPADARFVTAATPLTFTGVEAVSLRYKGQIVDQIGVASQSDDFAVDKSLYRNATVTQPSVIFDLTQWTTHATNYCDGLGQLLAVTEARNKPTIRLYPNPVIGNVLYLEGARAESAEVVDVVGRTYRVKFTRQNGKNTADVSMLKSGVYFLKIEGQTFKFIKK
ncbi:MAG: T9SS C-terminal target domain-containing protein [Chryseobacterium sp.]|nr:MAG: T9SS C-terminal target domain-containing protein [Chryseobacterium sp.]